MFSFCVDPLRVVLALRSDPAAPAPEVVDVPLLVVVSVLDDVELVVDVPLPPRAQAASISVPLYVWVLISAGRSARLLLVSVCLV